MSITEVTKFMVARGTITAVAATGLRMAMRSNVLTDMDFSDRQRR